MTHPRMYSDDDPYLSELRGLALELPEATEVEAWGRPTFRAGKIFAVYSGIEERPYGVIVKPDSDDRAALLQDARFYAPPYYGLAAGWRSTSTQRPSTGMRSPSCSMRRTVKSP